ncbi:MAG: tRNA (cytidine(34)-2'-O)-methyltransferase [Aquabacterium sp.]|nr:tRNA (cytidine(34)-2'-O)-methyltransferase [Aquabacterium sp.]
MFHIVLVQPQIPPNTGNVIRLAANTGSTLHLVEPLGFSMEDKLLRRAGLDYHEAARVHRHSNWQALRDARVQSGGRWWALTRHADQPLGAVAWQAGDWFVFGSEASGLPAEVLAAFAPDERVRLPMLPGQRSLNLSNAVAVVVFDAWRQSGYAGGV